MCVCVFICTYIYLVDPRGACLLDHTHLRRERESARARERESEREREREREKEREREREGETLAERWLWRR